MSKLNPLTNLPEDSVDPGTRNKKILEAYQQTKSRTMGEIGGSRVVQGAFGTYDPEIRVTSDRDFNEIRAQAQTTPELFGKALMNSVGIMVGGTVSAIGYMGDIFKDITMGVKGQQNTFDKNAVSRLGHSIESYFFDNFEIYQTERAQSGAFNPFANGSRLRDGTFWGSMFPSITSTVSLMIPSMGIALGLAKGAKLMGAGANTQRAVSTVGAAVANRHNYNRMEGHDLMERMMQRRMEEGASYSEAKSDAAKATSAFYTGAYVNLWKDMISWGALLRGFNFANRNVKESIVSAGLGESKTALQFIQSAAKNPTMFAKDIAKKAGYNWKDFALQSGLEGFEEFNIQFQKNHYERATDIELGLIDGDVESLFQAYGSSAWNTLMNDKDVQNATLMGFIGGATFQAIGGGVAAYRNKRITDESVARAERLQKSMNFIHERMKTVEQAAISGDVEAATRAEEEIVASLAFSGINLENISLSGSLLSGDLANNIEFFDVMASMDDAALGPDGLQFENPAEVRENAKKISKQLNRVSEIFEGHANRKDMSDMSNVISAIQLTEQEFFNEMNSERKNRLSTELDSFYGSNDIQVALNNLTPEQAAEIRKRARLRALKNLRKEKGKIKLDDLQGKQFSQYRFNILTKTRDKALAKIENEIQQLESELETIPSEEVRKFNESFLKGNEKHNNLQERLAITESELYEGELNLIEYNDPENITNIRNIMDSRSKNINDQVFQYMVREEAKDGRFVRIEDKVYKISNTEEGIFVQEYDQSTGELTGESEPFSADMVRVEGTKEETKDFEFVDAEFIVSKEQRDSLEKDFNKQVKENLNEAVKTLDKLRFSGLTEAYEKAKKEFLKVFGEKASSLQTTQEFLSFMDNVLDAATSVDLMQEIIAKTNEVFSEMQKVYLKERNQLLAAFSQQKELLSEVHEKLKDINKKVRELKAKAETNDINSKLQELQELITKNEAQKQALLQEHYYDVLTDTMTEAEKTALMEQVMQKHIDPLNSNIETLQQTILNKDTELQLEVVKTRKQIQTELDNLKKQRKELNAKKRELTKVIEVYEGIISSQDKLTIKSFILQEQSSIEKRIDFLKLSTALESGVSLKSLEHKVRNIEEKLTKAIEELMEYDAALEVLSESNLIVQRARAAALQTLLAQGVTVNELNNLSPSLINRYKTLLNKELTSRLKDSHVDKTKEISNQILKIVNDTRNDIINDVRDSALIGSVKGLGFESWQNILDNVYTKVKSLPQTLKEIQALELENKILNDVIGAMDSVLVKNFETSKEGESTTSELDTAKRTLETLFTRFTGKDHYEGELINDEASIRYSQFVNRTNPANKRVVMEMITYDDFKNRYGDVIPQEVQDDYKKRGAVILLALPTDGKGGYYNMYGEVTDTFDVTHNVYTSFPSTMSSLQFVNDEKYLQRRYPKIKDAAARKAAFEADYQQKLDEHKKFTAEIVNKLATGQPYYINVTGKSVGIPIENNKTRYSDNFVPNSLFDVVGDNFQLVIATSSEMEVGGNTFEVYPGKMYAFNPENGNIYRIDKRRLNEKELTSIVSLIRHYAEKQAIPEFETTKKVITLKKGKNKGKKKTVEQTKLKSEINKEIDINGEVINVFDYLNDLVGKAIDIKVKENKITIATYVEKADGSMERMNLEYSLFAKDSEGNLTNKLSDESAQGIYESLSTLVHNTRNKLDGNYVAKNITESGVETTLYSETDNFTGYENYLLENRVIGTRIAPKRTQTFESNSGGTTFDINSYQFMNQNFNFNNPLANQLQSKEQPKVGNTVITQEIKSLINKLTDLTKDGFSDERKAMLASIQSLVELGDFGNDFINMYDSLVALDFKEFDDVIIKELEEPTRETKKKYVLTWLKVNRLGKEVVTKDGFIIAPEATESEKTQLKEQSKGETKQDLMNEEIGLTKKEVLNQDTQPVKKEDLIIPAKPIVTKKVEPKQTPTNVTNKANSVIDSVLNKPKVKPKTAAPKLEETKVVSQPKSELSKQQEDSFKAIKTDSGKTLSELGFDANSWYILSANEQQNIIKCR